MAAYKKQKVSPALAVARAAARFIGTPKAPRKGSKQELAALRTQVSRQNGELAQLRTALAGLSIARLNSRIEPPAVSKEIKTLVTLLLSSVQAVGEFGRQLQLVFAEQQARTPLGDVVDQG